MAVRALALVALVALLPGWKAPSAAPLTPAAAQVWNVDRGTTAILLEDHRAPLVEIRLVFPVGTWSPWARRAGHLSEAFNSSFLDPGGRLRARADRLGVDVALAADARMSVLSLGCRKADLDSVADLARAILANRELDRAELRRRHRQASLEWSLGEKDPQTVLRRSVRRVLFPAGDPRRQPHERPERTSEDTGMLLATRDSMVRLPGRVIGLAGDLTRAESERLARGLLPPPLAVHAPATPRLPAAVAVAARPRGVDVSLPGLTQTHVALAREGPGMDEVDYAAFLVADHVLGGHFHSRLFQALRHDSGDAYATGTITDAETGPTAYALWTQTRAQNAAVAERKLRKVLEDLHARGITEQERADAVGYLQGRRLFSRQYPGRLLDEMLRNRSRGLPADHRETLTARVAALTPAQINDFIRRFYDPAAFTLVRVVRR